MEVEDRVEVNIVQRVEITVEKLIRKVEAWKRKEQTQKQSTPPSPPHPHPPIPTPSPLHPCPHLLPPHPPTHPIPPPPVRLRVSLERVWSAALPSWVFEAAMIYDRLFIAFVSFVSCFSLRQFVCYRLSFCCVFFFFSAVAFSVFRCLIFISSFLSFFILRPILQIYRHSHLYFSCVFQVLFIFCSLSAWSSFYQNIWLFLFSYLFASSWPISPA